MDLLTTIDALFKKAPNTVGIYRNSDLELYITNTARYDNAVSIIDKIKLFFAWKTAKSFQDLASLSGVTYHLIINTKSSDWKKLVNNCIFPHFSYKYRKNGPQKWIFSLIRFYQKKLYYKLGYEHVMVLEDKDEINGEVIRKKGNDYFVFHSNNKEKLYIKGKNVLSALNI